MTFPNQQSGLCGRFLRFRIATGLAEKEGNVQVSSLIYAMGPEAEHIFTSFMFEAEGETENDFDLVVQKFREHFIPKRNIIHERARFHQRSQKTGESIESFVRSLYEMAEHCNFAAKDEEIRDRLVVGIQDKDLSQKLQLKATLTLNHAVEMARQSELVKAQVAAQGSGLESSKDIEEVQQRQGRNWKYGGRRGQESGLTQRHRGQEHRGQRHSGQGHSNRGSQHRGGLGQGRGAIPREQRCRACGIGHRPEGRCPAAGKQCFRCNQVGHFSARCSSKSVREITTEEELNESFFLEAVNSRHADDAWFVMISMCGSEQKFKIDTGADITVMSEETYNKLPVQPVLQQQTANLISPGGRLDCRGRFTTEVTYKNKRHALRVYVAASQRASNLLGRNDAISMGLVQRLDHVGFEDVFGEIGLMKTTPVKVKRRSDASPYSITTPRRIPFPQMKAVEEELNRMLRMGIIEEVSEPTDWCAPMVPVPKKNGKVRICVDLKRLNEAVEREKFVLPTLEDVAPELTGATLFSTLDASSGFWQIPLDRESRRLTTFLTPFARYAFKRLPFGITSAPEIYQKKMVQLLEGLPGVKTVMDDILVYGDENTHDARLAAVLERIRASGIKLNKQKCNFKSTKVEYFGHQISAEGVHAAPSKVEAIKKLKAPENISELRRIIGMVNYIGKFIPSLSSQLRPLYELLEQTKAWVWGPPQQDAFERMKELVSETPALAFYDPAKPTIITADASSYGIGGALLQSHGEKILPVAFCSRTLTETERRYAQIEKELLASTWTCERFSRYLVGLEKFRLQTDHKPLLTVINKQDLDKAPIRCQRLLMRLMRFSPKAEYVPGKNMAIAELLSRDPLKGPENSECEESVTAYVDMVVRGKPIASEKIRQIQEASAKDNQIQAVMKCCLQGWPADYRKVADETQDFFQARTELSVYKGMLLHGNRIVVPAALRQTILDKIHDGHQGVQKCKERAKMTVWWPRITQDIVGKVATCTFCQKNKPSQRSEPLITTPLPQRPWHRLGVDLCEYGNKSYLIVMDYFSRYLEIAHLTRTTTQQVVGRLKNMFAHHGIAEEVITDNGPQFTSAEFATFGEYYGFSHTTTSPHFPQANGQVERGVQLAKNILKQADPALALMIYRATPTTPTGMSPAKLLMGREINTRLPILASNLKPQWPRGQMQRVCKADKKAKSTYEANFNKHNGVRPLRPLQNGDTVLVKLDNETGWKISGTVTEQQGPRSYWVTTPSGQYRRNRKHLQWVPPETQNNTTHIDVDMDTESVNTPITPDEGAPPTPECTMPAPAARSPVASNPDVTRTRSGRLIVKPHRYRE